MEFPHYLKSKKGGCWYKIINDTDAISVQHYKSINNCSIETNYANAATSDNPEPCSEAEFNAKFQEVLSILTTK
jgi:hypothetical protein